jgi:Uma2 family endonuclease
MSQPTEGPPVLESGDRLTREEFHRRYCARPDIRKAELVQGVVYVASPIRIRHHGDPHGLVVAWLRVFVAHTPGLRLAIEGSVYLAGDSEVQPDVFLYWEPPRAGSGRLRDDDYLEGPPVLVVEVAASSASYDLHDKKEAYRRAGVPEYIVWRIVDRLIDWFHLQDGEYVLLEPDEDGVIESRILPGLRLPVESLLAGDDAAVLAAVGVRFEP